MDQKRAFLIVLAAVTATVLTWFINHDLGYGPFIANGFIGIIAALTLPKDLAGAAYAASFVGMSGSFIIPSLALSVLAGIVVGIVLAATVPIYAGIGGKGGTTAAFAVLVTRGIMRVFGL